MSADYEEVAVYPQYCPPGVQQILGIGSHSYVGEVDESTVLKYTHEPGGDKTVLEHEHKILEIVGPHPRIIGLRRLSSAGLYLERAANGTLYDYLLEQVNPPPSLQQRLTWCREATEAVAHVHSKRVFHCDIQPTNLLLDKNLHLKLADFQGHVLSGEGEVILEGHSAEPCRFQLPRDDPCYADVKTEIFALGCTIYFIMTGHAVFPDIIDGEDGWCEKVQHRFKDGRFPRDSHACSAITLKCWEQKYENAVQVLRDICVIADSV